MKKAIITAMALFVLVLVNQAHSEQKLPHKKKPKLPVQIKLYYFPCARRSERSICFRKASF